jgi:hypothetical protein
MSQEYDVWAFEDNAESNPSNLAVQRFWPVALSSVAGIGSLFLPWVEIARTNGDSFTWSPSNFLPLMLFFGALFLVIGIIGYREWATQAVSPTITRIILLLTGLVLFVAALGFELGCSLFSGLGVALHYHSWTLAMSSGIGVWLASVAALAGLVGTLPASHFPNIGHGTFAARFKGTAPSLLVLLGTVLVSVGRNSSWFRIGWGAWHIGVASWAIPVVGSELRIIFVVWLLCLLLRRWAPLTALTILVFCELTTFFYGQAVRTFGPAISLDFVNQLVGTHYGQFHSNLSFGVILLQAGCVVAAIGTLWQMRRIADVELVLVESGGYV